MGVDVGNQTLLAPLVERLRLERNACKAETAGTDREVAAARVRDEELQAELATCQRERAAADRALADIESRSRVSREVLMQAEQRSNAAAAVLSQKEALLAQSLECISLVQKQFAQQQLEASRAIADASKLKFDADRLQQDLGEIRARHQSEVSSLRARAESARTKADSAMANQSALAVERDALRGHLEKARAAKEEQDKRMVSLQSVAASAASDAKASRAQLDRLRHELREGALREAQCRKEAESLRTLAASAKECEKAAVQCQEQPPKHGMEDTEKAEKKEEMETEEKKVAEDGARSDTAAATVNCVRAAQKAKPAVAAFEAAALRPALVPATPTVTPRPALPVAASAATARGMAQQPNKRYFAATPMGQLISDKSNGFVPFSRTQQPTPPTLLRRPSRVLHFKRSRSRIWRVEQHRCQPKRDVRRGRIERKDIAKVGYTAGCPGCDSIRNQTPRINHTDACRERVMKDMERLQLPAVRRLVDGERRIREQARLYSNFAGGAGHGEHVPHLPRHVPSDRAEQSDRHSPQVQLQAMSYQAQPRLIVSSSGT